jgi:hypothetical protein
MSTLICARCVKAAMFQFKIGAYTYCEVCVEKEPKWKEKLNEVTDDGVNVWTNIGKVMP